MDIKELQNLIRFVAKSGVSEVKYKTKDFEIDIKTPLGMGGEQAPLIPQSATITAIPTVVAPAPEISAETENTQGKPENETLLIPIKSPMIGTFYRKPAPDKEDFVKEGSEIKEGTVVCVIEAMKLFNQIESEVSGKIVKILVENATPVEYDQPLFLVKPL